MHLGTFWRRKVCKIEFIELPTFLHQSFLLLLLPKEEKYLNFFKERLFFVELEELCKERNATRMVQRMRNQQPTLITLHVNRHISLYMCYLRVTVI